MSLRSHQTVLASAGFSVIGFPGFGAPFQCRNHGPAAEHPPQQDAAEAALGHSFQPPGGAGGPAAEARGHGVPRLCPPDSNCQSQGRPLVLGGVGGSREALGSLVLSMLGRCSSKVWEKGLVPKERSMRAGAGRSGADTCVYHEQATSQPLWHAETRGSTRVVLLSVLGDVWEGDCPLLFTDSWFNVEFSPHLESVKWWCLNSGRMRGHIVLSVATVMKFRRSV